MYYSFKDTLAGMMLFIADEKKVLTGMHWVVFKDTPKVQPDWMEDEVVFSEAFKQLDEYFAGERTEFDFPYSLRGTKFQEDVWRELEKIPYGGISSYGQIAESIGRPKAVRAVGTAVGHNPISIVVPCHRVLSSMRTITGYAGGVESKRLLLDRENIAYTR